MTVPGVSGHRWPCTGAVACAGHATRGMRRAQFRGSGCQGLPSCQRFGAEVVGVEGDRCRANPRGRHIPRVLSKRGSETPAKAHALCRDGARGARAMRL